MYRVTLQGDKEAAKAALEEQSKKLIEEQNMTEEDRTNIGKLLDVLPDGSRLTGTIEDHNNGTVIINVTARRDVAEAAAALSVSKGTVATKSTTTDTSSIPGAGEVGGNPKAPQGQEKVVTKS